VNSSYKDNKGNYYVLFLISPILSIIQAFRFREIGVYKNILWLLAAFYGYTISFPSDIKNIDGLRRAENFRNMASLSDYSFDEFRRNFEDEESTNADLFEPLLVFSLSKITAEPANMFLVYGLLFGYFYSRNFAYVLDKVQEHKTRYLLYFLLLLSFQNPFWNLGGFRYWFATHLFLYGLLPYLFENKKKQLYWLLLAPLVHFSYVFALAIFLIFSFLGNRTNLFFIYFLVSLIARKIEIGFFKTLLEFIPSTSVQRKGDAYTNDQYVESIGSRNAMNWYADFENQYVLWLVVLILFFCFFKFKKEIEEKYGTVFCFILFYLGTVFFVGSIPSMPRFNTLGYMMVLSFFILFLNKYDFSVQLKKYMYVANFGIIISLIVGVRKAFDTVSLLFTFSNPFIAPFFLDVNFSMIDLFK
jgi:hypothetical protein